MCQGIPEKSSKAADDGTRTHFVLESYLKKRKPLLKGLSYDCPKTGRFHLDTDRMERVQFAIDYIESREAELGSTVQTEPERWLDSTPALGRDDMSGTTDVIITNGVILEVIDYKDGMSPVSAVNNEQMEIYGVCALHEMINVMGLKIEQVRLTVIQPKLRFNGEDGISIWDVSAQELLAKIEVIKAEAFATDDPDSRLVSGEKQCKWCPAKGGCLKVNNHVMEAIGVGFQSVDIAADITNVNPEKVSNERLKEMITALPLLRQLAEVVEMEALRRFETGNLVEGLKAVRGRGSKTWARDNDEIIDRLGKMKIPKDLRTKSQPITPTQTINLKWTNRKGEECTLTDRQKKILMDDYISVNEGKLKVVSENAPGKAVIIDVVGAFENIETKKQKEIETEIPDWMK